MLVKNAYNNGKMIYPMKVFIYFSLVMLSLSACAGDTSIRDYSPEQEWMLCNLATDENGAYYTKATYDGRGMGPRAWENRSRYVEEAKRRNLYCPTDLPKSTPRMVPRASATRVPPVPAQPSQRQSYEQNGANGITVSSTEARVESICRRRADVAKQSASRNHRPSNMSTDTTCRVNYFGKLDCSSSTGLSGGTWGGVLAGLEAVNAGRDAYDIEYESCLFQLSNR